MKNNEIGLTYDGRSVKTIKPYHEEPPGRDPYL